MFGFWENEEQEKASIKELNKTVHIILYLMAQ